MPLGTISPLFHIIFNIYVTSGGKLLIHLLNVVVQFIVFLNAATLICPGTDISKCFKETLGIRDNESRLYLPYVNIHTPYSLLYTSLQQDHLDNSECV